MTDIKKVENTKSKNILEGMKHYNEQEPEELSKAKTEEVKEFVKFFDEIRTNPYYIPLLRRISELNVSNLKVSTDIHGSLDAMLAPMLASGAFNLKPIRYKYAKIGDFLKDDDITLLTQDEFKKLSEAQKLEYFPILDLDFSDNDKIFIFNGDALDGGKFSINVFLTFLNLLRKQEKLLGDGRLEEKKFYFNFGNHELFALFDMSAPALGVRSQGMLPGFADNNMEQYSKLIKKYKECEKSKIELPQKYKESYKEYAKLCERREFYFGLIRNIIRKNFNLFDFCENFTIGSKSIQISHSIILQELLEKILTDLKGELEKVNDPVKSKISKIIEIFTKNTENRENCYVDYLELNKIIKNFISKMLSENKDIKNYYNFIKLFMASKSEFDSSKFRINFGNDNTIYKLNKKEKEIIYLIGHTIYDKNYFEKVSNCIVPMDFGASSEYAEYLEYLKTKNCQKKDNSELKPESCPRITIIIKDEKDIKAIIQIPLPLVEKDFKKDNICYVALFDENNKMSHTSFNIESSLYQNPEVFMNELKNKLEKLGIKLTKENPYECPRKPKAKVDEHDGLTYEQIENNILPWKEIKINTDIVILPTIKYPDADIPVAIKPKTPVITKLEEQRNKKQEIETQETQCPIK